jgi:hypothetical protein
MDADDSSQENSMDDERFDSCRRYGVAPLVRIESVLETRNHIKVAIPNLNALIIALEKHSVHVYG